MAHHHDHTYTTPLQFRQGGMERTCSGIISLSIIFGTEPATTAEALHVYPSLRIPCQHPRMVGKVCRQPGVPGALRHYRRESGARSLRNRGLSRKNWYPGSRRLVRPAAGGMSLRARGRRTWWPHHPALERLPWRLPTDAKAPVIASSRRHLGHRRWHPWPNAGGVST